MSEKIQAKYLDAESFLMEMMWQNGVFSFEELPESVKEEYELFLDREASDV